MNNILTPEQAARHLAAKALAAGYRPKLCTFIMIAKDNPCIGVFG